VGIGADEEIVVAVAVDRDIVLDHFLDDSVLFPPRHENGDPPLGRGIELGFGKPAKLRPPRQQAASHEQAQARSMNRSSRPFRSSHKANRTRQKKPSGWPAT